MAQYADRYSKFRNNGGMKPVFGIPISTQSSDKSFLYRKAKSRLDKVSNDYYNNPYSGWLIMLANPQYGGLEFNIPDNTILRIPFPYESALGRYITELENHIKLYGI
jgi:hypothetical protein